MALKKRETQEPCHEPRSLEEEPEEHEWGFLDRMIQRVLAWLPIAP